MKTLFVSCLLPYPGVLHGGGTDLFHLIESLSQRHEVHLVSIVGDDDLSHVSEIESYCASVKVVAPAWSWREKAQSVWAFGWRDPLSWGRRAKTQVRAFIRQTIRERNIDVVQFEWTETGQYLDAAPADIVVRVLDEMDVSFRPIAHRAMGRTSVLARWRAFRAEAEEVALCERFDAVLTRSESDRRVLMERLRAAPVEVLQPWTHVAQFADITASDRCRGRLLFVGAMDREENCRAVEYFCQQVLPLIRARTSGVEFHVVGAHPPDRLSRLAHHPGVRVVGYVNDLRAAYAACDVFVAPMLAPGGVFNKIIDAMGAGRPVVTTRLGNEGLAAPEGLAVLIARSPDDFADRTVALLRDEALWRLVGEGGRRYVRDVYKWEDNVARLEALYERLTSTRRARGGGRPRKG